MKTKCDKLTDPEIMIMIMDRRKCREYWRSSKDKDLNYVTWVSGVPESCTVCRFRVKDENQM